jgi:hypothetical protein
MGSNESFNLKQPNGNRDLLDFMSKNTNDRQRQGNPINTMSDATPNYNSSLIFNSSVPLSDNRGNNVNAFNYNTQPLMNLQQHTHYDFH